MDIVEIKNRFDTISKEYKKHIQEIDLTSKTLKELEVRVITLKGQLTELQYWYGILNNNSNNTGDGEFSEEYNK